MQAITTIPLLDFIKTQGKFPTHNFRIENKRSKRLPLFYSLISQDYSTQLLSVNNYVITQETITKLEIALENDNLNRINAIQYCKSFVTSLSIKNENQIDTHLIILSVLNGNRKSINIIRYQNTDLKNWLGGVFENESDLHLSVKYNLTDEESIRIFNLFSLFIELKNLKEFDKIVCGPNIKANKNTLPNRTELKVFNIDLSNLREYFIPTTNRREHYRWQLCGPGRTILRQVKIKETIVKKYTRKGKRII